MGLIEIRVKQVKLLGAVMTLKDMQERSSFLDKTDLFEKSQCSTADAVNSVYKSMQEIEKALIQLAKKTESAMESAASSFAAADSQAGNDFKMITALLK